ncbi:elongator complex protein 4 [Achroia grisella]|uniref:elongator complex protein 4 n=1 Tax=Achroia grisella TaxID=688607 RepID=UPI0027D2CA40|nr:elongator complex protein 4 [Achroia grisella]
MNSFHKANDFRVSINGTKLKNNLPFVSSGIPSLDYVIEEDILGNYSRVLTKYFLAEGVTCKHGLLVVSADENPTEIVHELPQPCTASSDDEIHTASRGVDKMKIAWRYEGLSQVESSFGSNTNFGHHFDLSKHIDADTIKNSNIRYCDPNIDKHDITGFQNNLYSNLINVIKDTISQEEYQQRAKQNKNMLRISIQSLGSPIWMAMDCDETGVGMRYGHDLIKFIYCLRVLLRDTNAVAFVTLPSHLFDDDNIMKRILYTVHNAVKIESFAGSSRETNPLYKDYHGLFHITKLSTPFSLVPFIPPSLDLAFKLKRKKFLIEKLHLPPELQESSEREQDDITAIPTCGGFKKKDIDF